VREPEPGRGTKAGNGRPRQACVTAHGPQVPALAKAPLRWLKRLAQQSHPDNERATCTCACGIPGGWGSR
jgi:hypothetical protein